MPAGRPSSYKPEYADLAYKFCLLKATDAQLAEFFEVDNATIYRWKNDFPEFCESIKNGKEIADGNVAKALYDRAVGCVTYEDRQVGEVVIRLEKKTAPDTAACFIWLKNRAGWRDQKQVEIDDKRPVRQLSEPEIDSRLEELQGRKAANG